MRLNQDEIRTIRKIAEKVARGRCLIEIGDRVSLKGAGHSINILLISEGLEHDDTDLHDYAPWSDIRGHIPLTEAGSALIDLYLSEPMKFGERGEMLDQIQVGIVDGRLAHIYNNGNTPIWSANV